MEHIRAKFGATNPRARLSRAVAGVAGKTQIYTLPGSVRAVEEYMPEILATLEHVTDVVGGRGPLLNRIAQSFAEVRTPC